MTKAETQKRIRELAKKIRDGMKALYHPLVEIATNSPVDYFTTKVVIEAAAQIVALIDPPANEDGKMLFDPPSKEPGEEE